MKTHLLRIAKLDEALNEFLWRKGNERLPAIPPILEVRLARESCLESLSQIVSEFSVHVPLAKVNKLIREARSS